MRKVMLAVVLAIGLSMLCSIRAICEAPASEEDKVAEGSMKLPPEKPTAMKEDLETILKMESALRTKTGKDTAEALANAKTALRYFEEHAALTYLRSGLDSPLTEVQAETLRILRRLKDVGAVPLIVDRMKALVSAQEASTSGGEEYGSRNTTLLEGLKTLEVLTGRKLMNGKTVNDLESVKRALEKLSQLTPGAPTRPTQQK